MDKLIIGSHVSFNKDNQLLGSVLETLSYGANTLMLYTGAPQNTNRAILDMNLTKQAHELMLENGINPSDILAHAPYIINLGNNEKPDSYQFAIDFLKQEISRCEELGITKLVLHPGSSVNLDRKTGINNIIDALNIAIRPNQHVKILLETMSGKGSEIGSNFFELREIIDGICCKDKVGICLDTCHLNDAGYDITNFDAVLNEFDKVVGLDLVGCIHINDSKNEVGAHKDRHENFGFGSIGFDNLIKIIYNPRLESVPKILETPYVSEIDESKDRLYPPYKFEITMIRSKVFNPNLLNDIRNFYK